MYPLAYAPQTRRFYFDVDCPLKPAYFAQLANADSEASLHLGQMVELIQNLEPIDPAFLATNFAIDADYFELEALPINPWTVRKPL
jgi:hypothetical protein